MKSLYEALLDGIPEDAPVDDVVCTRHGVIVYSQGNIGLAERDGDWDTRPMLESADKRTLTLKQLARGILSWNLTEAAMGHAAINAWYNSPEQGLKNGLPLTRSLHSEDRGADPFISYQKDVRGKKVVVVGHFPYLEKLIQPICDLYILEAEPTPGDYPEQAAEYLLPDCDFAFIGGMTFIDKRLPRYLELARDAFVGLVGPVTPLAPVLFDYGVDEMDGFVAKAPAIAESIFKGQSNGKIYSAGQKVSLRKTEYEKFCRG